MAMGSEISGEVCGFTRQKNALAACYALRTTTGRLSLPDSVVKRNCWVNYRQNHGGRSKNREQKPLHQISPFLGMTVKLCSS